MTVKTNINQEMSLAIAKKIRARSGECYVNSMRGLLGLTNNGGYSYVEGYAIDTSTNEMFSHAWVENDGEVIETTPVWRKMKNVPYFAGARYSLADIALIVTQFTDEYEVPLVLWLSNNKQIANYKKAKKEGKRWITQRITQRITQQERL